MDKISSINDGKYDEKKTNSTPIQEFYENQNIFITGGTGFIGKVLNEKLLRSCSGIERIYVLIRKKKDKDFQQRLQNLLKEPVFDKLRMTMPDFEKKMIGIAGDISLESVGLSDDDAALIKKDVSIVFHPAATVRLDDPLKITIATNLQSTVTMLNLCKDMKNLKNMSILSNISEEKYDVEKIQSTPIQEYYRNQTIFITGGTGFLGKVLIEKLLRSCPGIERIYVFMRKKKDKDVQQRLQNLLEDTVFNKLRMTRPNFEKKIIGIAGDVSLENLGISDPDVALIKKDVSVIFHCAATVRFDESLKVAVSTNLRSTITIHSWCKDMKNLKAFVYVSTVYAHCFNNQIIEEKTYNYPISYKEILIVDSLSEEVTETISPVLTKPWLSTYTCSKASAENFLADKSQNLPVVIFRPPIVAASAYEPMPGWVDSYNGSTGMIAGAVAGVIRAVRGDRKKRIDIVPVDFTVNALIACAWDVNTQPTRRGKNMLIYNFAPTRDAPITLNMMRELILKYSETYPYSETLWYPFIRLDKYKNMYNIYKILLHSMPAFVIDLLARSFGKKPGMMKLYEKIHKMCDLLEYFTINEWDIKCENLQRLWSKLQPSDQTIFQFTMQSFDWDKYFSTYIKGIRIYLLKDDLKTLNASRTRYKRLFLLNQVTRAALIFSAYLTIRKVLEIKRNYKPLN